MSTIENGHLEVLYGGQEGSEASVLVPIGHVILQPHSTGQASPPRPELISFVHISRIILLKSHGHVSPLCLFLRRVVFVCCDSHAANECLECGNGLGIALDIYIPQC